MSAADTAASRPLSRRDLLINAVKTAVVCPALASCAYIDLRNVQGGGGGGGVQFSTHDPTHAALAEVGGQSCIAVGPVQLMLYRVDDLEIVAFDRICPHQALEFGNCDGSLPVLFDPDERTLTCPWHASVFDETGAVFSGPATRGIHFYPVTYDATSGVGTIQIAVSEGSSPTEGA